MNLAEKLTIQRKKSGMSQEQLAERLGITRQSVSKWEAGSSMPEISKLIALSELFQVSLDYLLKDYLDEDKGRISAEDVNEDRQQEDRRKWTNLPDMSEASNIRARRGSWAYRWYLSVSAGVWEETG